MKRNYSKEIIDDFSIVDERIINSLKELKIINKFLGGNSTTYKGFKKILKNSPKKEINILDIGAGSSENIDRYKFESKKINIISVDINLGICKYQNKNFSNNVICANALDLPLKDNSIDIIHASLFLHHFNESDIQKILKQFLKIANIGIVINDLNRSIFALAGISILTKLFSKSDMVKNDAPLSVKRGFNKNELKNIFKNLQIENYEITHHWAFRYLCVIRL